MMNANSSVEEITTPEIETIETIEIVEDFGCRGDCNADARAGAMALAIDQDDRSSDGELYRIWSEMYHHCTVNEC
jgi:hypothetical protein